MVVSPVHHTSGMAAAALDTLLLVAELIQSK